MLFYIVFLYLRENKIFMELLERVSVNPNICGVELAFNGELTAANITDWQEFFNSMMTGTDFTKTYAGMGSVSFDEESGESPAGTSYKQKIQIRFPSNDVNRSVRIDFLQKVKFIKLKLTNGSDLVIGRNDYVQNARPRIKTKTNIKTAEVEFETVSIFPSGFVSNPDNYGFPSLIPITLY